jgi:hypothetical protein
MEYNLEIQPSTPHHKQLQHNEFTPWCEPLNYNTMETSFQEWLVELPTNKEDFKLIPI